MRELLQEWIIQYGYAALYALLAAGIVGVPVPDEILMTFVGYLTSERLFGFGPSLAVSFAGAMTGMMASYYLGKRVGKPFLIRYGRWVKLTPARLDRAEEWFREYGLWTVSFGYFVPGIRHFTCYLAGVSGVALWKYLLYAGSGALVWCATFIALGHFLGQNIDAILNDFHHYIGRGAVAVLALAAIIGFFANRTRIRTRARK